MKSIRSSIIIILSFTFIALSACQNKESRPATPPAANTIGRDLKAVLDAVQANQINLTQAIFYSDNTAVFIAQDKPDSLNAKQYHVSAGQITKVTPFQIETSSPNFFASSLIRPSVIAEVCAEAMKRGGGTSPKISQIAIFKNPSNTNQVVITLIITGDNQSKSVTADIAGNILSIS